MSRRRTEPSAYRVTLVRFPGEEWGLKLGFGRAVGGHRFYLVPHLDPESIATRGGLRRGDRVHLINGRDLSEDLMGQGGSALTWDSEASNPETLTLRLEVTRGQSEAEMRAEISRPEFRLFRRGRESTEHHSISDAVHVDNMM